MHIAGQRFLDSTLLEFDDNESIKFRPIRCLLGIGGEALGRPIKRQAIPYAAFPAAEISR
jgi:hypothetical protein